MRKESKDFLFKLLKTASPSGFEQKIQKVVKSYVKSFADEISIDVHGNLIAAYNPDAPVRIMLAGHCDQIGLMVTHIDSKGFIWINQIGGVDPAVLPGLQVRIHTRDGDIDGIIGHTPIHLLEAAERGRQLKLSKLWVDIGAKDGKAAKAKVSVGDPITYATDAMMLGSHAITSPACDDKAGVYVVMEALRLFAAKNKGAAKKKCPVGLFAVSTVQEEVGLRGAKTSCFGIDPIAGIAVDVTHATDNPGADAKKVGTVELGKGPTIARGANINPVLEGLLVDTAKKKKLPVQSLAAPRATGTDANVIQVSRAGVAAALIGLPNRYMHTSAEVVDLRDLDVAAKLIAETAHRITKKTSFIPS